MYNTQLVLRCTCNRWRSKIRHYRQTHTHNPSAVCLICVNSDYDIMLLFPPLNTVSLVQAPTIVAIEVLPLKIQPSDQIIIRAEITSSARSVFISWTHNNATYQRHIKANPICSDAKDKVSVSPPHMRDA